MYLKTRISWDVFLETSKFGYGETLPEDQLPWTNAYVRREYIVAK